MIAVMAKAGLRVTELCQLRWRAVDVHHERLIIEEAKTEAGKREVDLTLDVIEELNAWRSRTWLGQARRIRVRHGEREAPRQGQRPHSARTGRRAGERGTRCRRPGFAPAGGAAHPAAHVHQPDARGRRAVALVMDQVGHEDSKTTLEIYALVQKRLSRPEVKRRFEELLAGSDFGDPGFPAEGRGKMFRQTARSPKKGSRKTAKVARGPQKWSTNAESTPRG